MALQSNWVPSRPAEERKSERKEPEAKASQSNQSHDDGTGVQSLDVCTSQIKLPTPCDNDGGGAQERCHAK